MTKGSQRLTFVLRLRKRHFLEKKNKGIRQVFTSLRKHLFLLRSTPLGTFRETSPAA